MVQMTDLIEKKKLARALSPEEISWLIERYTKGDVPDYQMSAFLMAVYFNGMKKDELAQFTMDMAESGDQIDFSMVDGLTVDKHSTGGVGDTTSLILVPLVASLGVHVPKMSGRGLGHTGGTIDKLESIPGFDVSMPEDAFISQVNQLHCAIVGQTGNLAPADKKIYALRDVTATVDAIPLIASSIMSKKIASGADAIVLDVKVGAGSFMKTLADAEQLARTMIEIGQLAGRKMMAVVSDMSQPLGYAVGNILEVKEAIACLKGEGPEDLTELSVQLASQMAHLVGVGDDLADAKQQVEEQIRNGQALDYFQQMVESQSGDASYISDPDQFPQADKLIPFKASRQGILSELDALAVGRSTRILGAGRETLDDDLDLTAGLVLEKKIGDPVDQGEVIANLHTNKSDDLINQALEIMEEAVTISDHADKPVLVHEILQ